jgi:hypothetical protein
LGASVPVNTQRWDILNSGKLIEHDGGGNLEMTVDNTDSSTRTARLRSRYQLIGDLTIDMRMVNAGPGNDNQYAGIRAIDTLSGNYWEMVRQLGSGGDSNRIRWRYWNGLTLTQVGTGTSAGGVMVFRITRTNGSFEGFWINGTGSLGVAALTSNADINVELLNWCDVPFYPTNKHDYDYVNVTADFWICMEISLSSSSSSTSSSSSSSISSSSVSSAEFFTLRSFDSGPSQNTGNTNERYWIDPTRIGASGTTVRLAFMRGALDTPISGCAIGITTSGSVPDFTSAPTRITFDGGQNGTILTGDALDIIYSDEISFTVNGNQDILISVWYPLAGNSMLKMNASNDLADQWSDDSLKGFDESQVQSIIGYQNIGTSYPLNLYSVEIK